MEALLIVVIVVAVVAWLCAGRRRPGRARPGRQDCRYG
jgi:hypothetical protein